MSSDEQLQLWVGGESVHNNSIPDGGVCCPDFSCCHPGLKWSKPEREKFAEAVRSGDEQLKMQMLMGSLKSVLDYTETRKVLIVS